MAQVTVPQLTVIHLQCSTVQLQNIPFSYKHVAQVTAIHLQSCSAQLLTLFLQARGSGDCHAELHGTTAYPFPSNPRILQVA